MRIIYGFSISSQKGSSSAYVSGLSLAFDRSGWKYVNYWSLAQILHLGKIYLHVPAVLLLNLLAFFLWKGSGKSVTDEASCPIYGYLAENQLPRNGSGDKLEATLGWGH